MQSAPVAPLSETADCSQCGSPLVQDARYCHMCGARVGQAQPPAEPRPVVQTRWIYVDLWDLKLPGEMASLDARAEAAAYVHERFAPFADDGWEWVVHPADRSFHGWLYQAENGILKLAGAELLCRRVLDPADSASAESAHHVSPHRVRQLAQRLWVA